jgi:hypothetical protein
VARRRPRLAPALPSADMEALQIGARMLPERMPLPDEQVKAYLWDIRDAAWEFAELVHGVNLEQFEKNNVLRYVVERQLRLIGDVADPIPLRYRDKHPEILAPLRKLLSEKKVPYLVLNIK